MFKFISCAILAAGVMLVGPQIQQSEAGGRYHNHHRHHGYHYGHHHHYHHGYNYRPRSYRYNYYQPRGYRYNSGFHYSTPGFRFYYRF